MELIVVIHVTSSEQVQRNKDICIAAGVKNIFLISHSKDDELVLREAMRIKHDRPDMFVGVNLLGLGKYALDEYPPYELGDVDALWIDETLYVEDFVDRRAPKAKIFGGLQFKYQPQIEDKSLKYVCEKTPNVTYCAVTSGSKTGKPPTVEHVATLRKYLGDHPLAIASGINHDNVADFKGIVDYVIVASSITEETEIINPEKLDVLIKAIYE